MIKYITEELMLDTIEILELLDCPNWERDYKTDFKFGQGTSLYDLKATRFYNSEKKLDFTKNEAEKILKAKLSELINKTIKNLNIQVHHGWVPKDDNSGECYSGWSLSANVILNKQTERIVINTK